MGNEHRAQICLSDIGIGVEDGRDMVFVYGSDNGTPGISFTGGICDLLARIDRIIFAGGMVDP